MDVTNSFDRLQKEIDALTYNSRSVLNALIRSVLVSGSSNGFSVTKLGKKITLSVVDIYRLYTFYTQWEANNFATAPSAKALDFTQILTAQNLDPVRATSREHPGTILISTTGTTNALVKHSEILYLSESNQGDYIDVDAIGNLPIDNPQVKFWLGLIKNNQNPKLVSNSAPIPINLRTPIFDQNLATTAYNQYNSYLFPMGYYIMWALGYPGDGVDHSMGGKSWSVICDDFIRLEAPRISMGGVTPGSLTKTWQNRNNAVNNNGADINPSPFSTTWGLDTFARSVYSTAGGHSTVIPEEPPLSYSNNTDGVQNPKMMAGVAIGSESIVSAGYGAAVGGQNNSIAGGWGAIIGGIGNAVEAPYGAILGGVANVVGRQVYEWRTLTSASTTNEPCNYHIMDGKCVPAETGSITASQILISDPTIDIKQGDIVVLSDFIVTVNGVSQNFTNPNGQFWKSLVTTVSGKGTAPTPSTGFIITIENNLPTGANVVVTGGKISVRSRTYADIGTQTFGHSSVALNFYTVAQGIYQTVVGSYNTWNNPDDTYGRGTARFIVGVGNNINDRQNRLEVTLGATFIYGTPNGTRAGNNPVPFNRTPDSYSNGYIGQTISEFMIESVVKYTNLRLTDTSWELAYNILQNTNATYSTSYISFNTNKDKSLVFRNANSATSTSSIKMFTGNADPSVYSPSISGPGRIGRFNAIYGWNDYRYMTPDMLDIALMASDNTYISAYNTEKVVHKGNVKLYASNSIVLLTDNTVTGGGNLTADIFNNISLTWGGKLQLSGQTYGALTARSDGTTFVVNGLQNIGADIDSIDNITQSGFFTPAIFSNLTNSNGTFPVDTKTWNQGMTSPNLISISSDVGSNSVRDVYSQLLFPGSFTSGTGRALETVYSDRRISFRSADYLDNSNTTTWGPWQPLAFYKEYITYNDYIGDLTKLKLPYVMVDRIVFTNGSTNGNNVFSQQGIDASKAYNLYLNGRFTLEVAVKSNHIDVYMSVNIYEIHQMWKTLQNAQALNTQVYGMMFTLKLIDVNNFPIKYTRTGIDIFTSQTQFKQESNGPNTTWWQYVAVVSDDRNNYNSVIFQRYANTNRNGFSVWSLDRLGEEDNILQLFNFTMKQVP